MKITFQTIKTPAMKKFAAYTLFLLIFSGCSKQSGDATSRNEPIDPNKKYSISFEMEDQQVKTSVSADTLYLDFYEKVNFLLDKSEFNSTWGIGKDQDFSKTNLDKLHFTALAEYGNIAYDWVTLNLNNTHPSQKTVSDVTVNGKQYTKVSLSRVFHFFNPLQDNAAATAKESSLLSVKTDSVKYTVFYFQDNINSQPSTVTRAITYSKK
jgi:hypothetical protein